MPVEKLESTCGLACGANLGWGRAEETWAGQKKEEKRETTRRLVGRDLGGDRRKN